jgi:hypothetical protein
MRNRFHLEHPARNNSQFSIFNFQFSIQLRSPPARFLRRAAPFILVLASFQPRVLAQASLQTIITNGPVSNRFNIAFLSEGYTNTQQTLFLQNVSNAINGLFARLPYSQPYTEYRPYFNAFAIYTNSVEAGSDHPYNGIFHDTYFNSTYDSNSDYLITIPPNFTDTNYSHGQGKVDALLQSFMPNTHLPILLVNDANPGGSDGFFKTAISYTGASLPGILTHETGHVVANLGDEYTNANPGFPDIEEPNTTQQTNRASIKWNAWISPGTPIPTPDTDGADVGLFQGAHYHATNWYRPMLNCLMKDANNFNSFCPVCQEALVLAIYGKVRPVDAYSPSNTSLSISTTQSVAFALTLLQPATHSLNVQWYTNGTALAGSTNPIFSVLPQSLGNGIQHVSAVVKDNTAFVRNDPSNLLSQTITWTLNVNILQLALDSPTWLSGGRFAFRVSGNAPQGLSIQATTNLSTWLPLATNNLVSGQFWYTNSGASNFPSRFFRAVTPP